MRRVVKVASESMIRKKRKEVPIFVGEKQCG